MPATRIVNKALQTWWRFSRALTLGAQGVVIDADDRVLLVRHGYRPGWHFPGGGVELRESVETALARELEEEAGVHLADRPMLHGLFDNSAAFPGDHIAVFVVRAWTRPVIPAPNREIVEQGFFPRDSLPDNTVAGACRRLAEIFDGQPTSATW